MLAGYGRGEQAFLPYLRSLIARRLGDFSEFPGRNDPGAKGHPMEIMRLLSSPRLVKSSDVFLPVGVSTAFLLGQLLPTGSCTPPHSLISIL